MELQDFWLSRKNTLQFLDSLATEGIAGTLYLPAGLLEREVTGIFKGSFPGREFPAGLAGPAAQAPAGAVFFVKANGGWLVLPPLEIGERGFIPGLAAGPLRRLLEKDWRISFVLVRLGAYALGLSEGETLVYQKAGTGLVHGRHKKGGSSQARFRRHREKQIEYFLTRICGHIGERLALEVPSVDYVVYGGAWTTLLLLEKRCPVAARLAARRLPPLLDIAKPSRAVLAGVVTRVWSSRVLAWEQEDEAYRGGAGNAGLPAGL